MKKTIAIVLAVMMMACVFCACGSEEEPAAPAAEAAPAAAPEAEAPVADAAAPAGEAPAGEASGEPSGEASGEPMEVEFFEPTDAYSRDFEGFRQYCIDGFLADQFHPEELEESTLAEFNAMTEDDYMNGDRYVALTDLGVLCTYEEFLAS